MREVCGYPQYIIDEDGTVYNKRHPDKPLSYWVDSLGYKMMVLHKNKKRCYVRVHRLVAETYILHDARFTQVNHIDGDKLNNNVNNLEWVTNAENTKKAYDLGLYTSKKQCEVIAYPKDGSAPLKFPSIRAMSKALKINRKTITSIMKGEKKTNNYAYTFEYAA